VTAWLPQLLAVVLSVGVINLVERGIRSAVARRKATRPEVVENRKVHDAVAQADQSIAVIAKARDDLAEDNRMLREQSGIDRQRYIKDLDFLRLRVAELEAERAVMRKEIDSMETMLRHALQEIEEMKRRYGIATKKKETP
jgi:hypothetical protein